MRAVSAAIVLLAGVALFAVGYVRVSVHRKDFIARPSGPGTVTVTITVAGPQPGSQPQVTRYEFTVK